ncbi:MAG: LegC family aminotransferase [Candidatus Devosia symbiotica]|nr:LegC family aminotransferase [Candidatus Devosia symbiotica]
MSSDGISARYSHLIAAIRSVVGSDATPVQLHEPTFRGREWDYLKDCLDSTFVSSVGAYVDRFEIMLAEATGAGFAIAAANGTSALQVALLLAGVETGTEVLMPALTFVGTANAVSHANAIPHFIDSEMTSLGVDAEKLVDYLDRVAEQSDGRLFNRATGRRISALLPVHIFGLPYDIDAMHKVANTYGIALVEDIAEALGSTYRGRGIAAKTRFGALSFNGNKIITTGGGGAILTNDPEIARRAKKLTTTAKRPHPWSFDHDEVAFNLRLPNLNAALGCAQLEQLDGFLAAKRRIATAYKNAFANLLDVNFIDEPAYGNSNFWLNGILLDRPDTELRNAVLQATHTAGLMTRPIWTLMHRLPMYQGCPRDNLDVASNIEARVISLPSSSHLAEIP